MAIFGKKKEETKPPESPKHLYWTKWKRATMLDLCEDGIEIEIEIDGSMDTGNAELIREERDTTDIPDPEGFTVDMNGIPYDEYVLNPEGYTIIAEILYRKSDLDIYNPGPVTYMA